MGYTAELTEHIKKQLSKIYKKDRTLYERVFKKIESIVENPFLQKPLKNKLKGKRRAHVDPFVIIFSIEDNVILFHHIKHHDMAY